MSSRICGLRHVRGAANRTRVRPIQRPARRESIAMMFPTRRGTHAFSVLAAIAMLAMCAGAQAQSHWPDANFHDSFDGIASGPANDADAARFLAQATFGPTPADITHLRTVGYDGWLNEQFAATPS